MGEPYSDNLPKSDSDSTSNKQDDHISLPSDCKETRAQIEKQESRPNQDANG